MTNGPEGAAAVVAARITETLGNRVWLDAHAARHGYDLEQYPLPTPGRIESVDPGQLALEDWPAVLVTTTQTVAMKPVDPPEDGTVELLVTYALEVLLFVRAEDETATDLLRKRYVLATREALHAQTSIGTGRIVAGSIAEDYSGQLTPQEGDVVAAARTALRLVLLETSPGAEPLGVVEQVVVDPRAAYDAFDS